MLDKIISSIEKSKIEKPKPESTHLAGSSESKSRTCPACGGESFWQPKRSDAWLCWDCEPPRSPNLVAQTLGGRQETQGPSSLLDGLEGFRRFWRAYRGPMIVWHQHPICKCGCDVTEEEWRPDGATKICVDCRSVVDFDSRVGVQIIKSDEAGGRDGK